MRTPGTPRTRPSSFSWSDPPHLAHEEWRLGGHGHRVSLLRLSPALLPREMGARGVDGLSMLVVDVAGDREIEEYTLRGRRRRVSVFATEASPRLSLWSPAAAGCTSLRRPYAGHRCTAASRGRRRADSPGRRAPASVVRHGLDRTLVRGFTPRSARTAPRSPPRPARGADGASPEQRRREPPLLLLEREHALLDAPRDVQVVHEDRPRLPDAVRAVGRLRLRRRVPPRIVVHDRVGARQVQPRAPGLEADEEDVGPALLERVDDALPVARLAREHEVPDVARAQRLARRAPACS